MSEPGKNEVRLELLVGCRVVDATGAKVGRIEEVLAERDGDELLVTAYLVGVYGFFRTFSIRGFGLGILSLFGARVRSQKPHRIPWDKLDLTDPAHPRLTCTIDEL